MILRSTLSCFALGAFVSGGLFLGPTSAHADIKNSAFYKGAAIVKENHHRHGNGTAGEFDVEVRRFMTGPNQKDMICDYQAYVKLTLPSRYEYTDLSSFHEGCNQYLVGGWFTFPQYGSRSEHDEWPQGSRFEGGWRDNFTGGEFKRIGSRAL